MKTTVYCLGCGGKYEVHPARLRAGWAASKYCPLCQKVRRAENRRKHNERRAYSGLGGGVGVVPHSLEVRSMEEIALLRHETLAQVKYAGCTALAKLRKRADIRKLLVRLPRFPSDVEQVEEWRRWCRHWQEVSTFLGQNYFFEEAAEVWALAEALDAKLQAIHHELTRPDDSVELAAWLRERAMFNYGRGREWKVPKEDPHRRAYHNRASGLSVYGEPLRAAPRHFPSYQSTDNEL